VRGLELLEEEDVKGEKETRRRRREIVSFLDLAKREEDWRKRSMEREHG